jgi:hypothetical protein
MRILNSIRKILMPLVWHRHLIENIAAAELRAIREEIKRLTPDNPNLRGFKVYSQSDEDGIIEEIFRRIGGGKTFIEIGCGNGIQNNTHYLLLKGWNGVWIDGDDKNVSLITKYLPNNPERLRVLKLFINLQNVGSIAADADFLSLDIDGNDLHILGQFLSIATPRVICVEYNAKFPPPMAISVKYDEGHRWNEDDYQGASLQAFVDLLIGYQLVACSVSGVNAFFVRKDLASCFTAYPVDRLYRPFRIELFHPYSGHPPSLRFLANEIQLA